jgi:signal transduction histidine kinase
MKDDFIANFTHELKTPIAVIYAALDNIERRPELWEEAVSVGKSQLKRLSDSVEKILSLSVEEHGHIELHREETPIYHWLASIIEPFRLKTEKEVTFELTVNPPDAKASISRMHFANVLNNIIDNAIKYSGNQVHIIIDCQLMMQSLCIAIHDNGFGIAPDDVKKIFDRFYRVKTTAGKVKGFGLGLNYSQTIVEMHGGTIRVESEPEKGSTFIIEI